MHISDLDREEYRDIKLYTMEENNNGGIPVYIRRAEIGKDASLLHRHESIQVNYINRGKVLHTVNRSTYELVRGDIFIIPPYIPHQLTAVGDTTFSFTELEFMPGFIFSGESGGLSMEKGGASLFDFSYIEPFLVSERNVRPRLNLTGDKRELVEGLLEDIYREYTCRYDSFLLALKADILKLLVEVARYFRENTAEQDTDVYERHRDAMAASLAYVRAHYQEQVGVETAARIAMLSPSYYRYLFKAVTGKTFVEYVTELRVQRAMELLKTTGLRVADICFDTGFNNLTHFNRTFKQAVGTSPTEYRKANRK